MLPQNITSPHYTLLQWSVTALLQFVLTAAAFGQPVALTTPRTSVILSNASYEYSASGVFDGRWHLLYTTGFVAGDHSFYTTSVEPRRNWVRGAPCFGPTWRPESFDGAQVADVNVVWHGNRFYQYYTGFPTGNSPLPKTSAIGVVSGATPAAFYRPKTVTQPIVEAHDFPRFAQNKSRNYGAGQPSAVSRADDGKLYLFFTDSTAPGSDANGGSLYAIRSRDPMFRGRVEELTANGWVDRPNVAALRRTRSIWPVISGEVAYIPSKRQWLVAINGIPGHTSFLFFDEQFKSPPYIINTPGIDWAEGPGLFRTWSGYTLPHASGSSDMLSLIWTYPSGNRSEPSTWDIRLASMDVWLD